MSGQQHCHMFSHMSNAKRINKSCKADSFSVFNCLDQVCGRLGAHPFQAGQGFRIQLEKIRIGGQQFFFDELVDDFISQSITLSGAVALARGSFVDALERFETALKVQGTRRSVQIILGEDCGQLGLAAALLQLGRMDEAQALLRTHLQQAVATHRQDRLLYALVGVALLAARQGDIERAVELYSLAASYPFVGKSQWFWDTFGETLIREREELQDPTHHDSIEYLYNVMKQRQHATVTP